jgi:hypothetical protein
VHILVEDVSAMRRALENAGPEVGDEHEVIVVDVEDRPGTMAGVTRRITDAGVNIELAYTTFRGVRLVLGSTTSRRRARRSDPSTTSPECGWRIGGVR